MPFHSWPVVSAAGIGIALCLHGRGLSSSSRIDAARLLEPLLVRRPVDIGQHDRSTGRSGRTGPPTWRTRRESSCDVHGHSPALADGLVGRIGEAAEDLQIGDQRVHLRQLARARRRRRARWSPRRSAWPRPRRAGCRAPPGRRRRRAHWRSSRRCRARRPRACALRCLPRSSVLSALRSSRAIGRHDRLRHHVARIDQMRAPAIRRNTCRRCARDRGRCAWSPTASDGRTWIRRPANTGRSARPRRAGCGSSASGRRSSPRGRRCCGRPARAACRRRMSGASSTVWWMVNSGAISTMPPMLATSDDGDHEPDRLAFEPVVKAEHARHSAACGTGRTGTSARDSRPRIRHRLRRRHAHRHPDVVAADQRADQEQQPADRAGDVVRMHRHQGVDEGIGQRPVVVVGPPHQSLDDARVPHRQHVDDGPRQREPEMPLRPAAANTCSRASTATAPRHRSSRR